MQSSDSDTVQRFWVLLATMNERRASTPLVLLSPSPIHSRPNRHWATQRWG